MPLPRIVLLIMFIMPASLVHAAELPVGGSVTVTSDYVLRGVSQSDGKPTWQAEGYIEPASQWRAGIWAADVRLLPPEHSTELDIYLGRQWLVNADLVVASTLTRYTYVNDPRPVSYTYHELNLRLNWRDAWLAGVSWSPDHTLVSLPADIRTNQQTMTLEAGYHGVLPHDMEWLLGVGYFNPLQLHEGDYVFGNARLLRRFGTVRVELGWFWTQGERQRAYAPGKAGGPWVLTLTYSFNGMH